MPRIARIDYPGAVHHIMARGWERRAIFQDEEDRRKFRDRLGAVLTETQTPCYAWTLMPNHVHLLLETGKAPISLVMRKLLTGYAVEFNRRWKRSGHLFQNRFRSLLCEKDSYFLSLLRYIHRNPVKDGLLSSAAALERFPWCGHGAILGNANFPWQKTDFVLDLFAPRQAEARESYRRFVEAEDGEAAEDPASWEIRFRDAEGVWQANSTEEAGPPNAKEFLLGQEGFMSQAIERAGDSFANAVEGQNTESKVQRIFVRAAQAAGISVKEILGRSKYPRTCLARALAVTWLTRELHFNSTKISKRLGISRQAVSKNLQKGQSLST